MEVDRVEATRRTISIPSTLIRSRKYVVAMAPSSLSHPHSL
jgi:hypothetical protein